MSTIATFVPPSRLRAPLLTGAGVAALTLALRLRDPHAPGSWGLCPLLAIAGASCPGCGGLRAVNDLTHGDLAAAASSNLLFVALVPFLVLGWAWWVVAAAAGRPGPLSRPTPAVQAFGFALLVAVVAFTVLRNLPIGHWLAP